jgi:hypothetical protein
VCQGSWPTCRIFVESHDFFSADAKHDVNDHSSSDERVDAASPVNVIIPSPDDDIDGVSSFLPVPIPQPSSSFSSPVVSFPSSYDVSSSSSMEVDAAIMPFPSHAHSDDQFVGLSAFDEHHVISPPHPSLGLSLVDSSSTSAASSMTDDDASSSVSSLFDVSSSSSPLLPSLPSLVLAPPSPLLAASQTSTVSSISPNTEISVLSIRSSATIMSREALLRLKMTVRRGYVPGGLLPSVVVPPSMGTATTTPTTIASNDVVATSAATDVPSDLVLATSRPSSPSSSPSWSSSVSVSSSPSPPDVSPPSSPLVDISSPPSPPLSPPSPSPPPPVLLSESQVQNAVVEMIAAEEATASLVASGRGGPRNLRSVLFPRARKARGTGYRALRRRRREMMEAGLPLPPELVPKRRSRRPTRTMVMDTPHAKAAAVVL